MVRKFSSCLPVLLLLATPCLGDFEASIVLDWSSMNVQFFGTGAGTADLDLSPGFGFGATDVFVDTVNGPFSDSDSEFDLVTPLSASIDDGGVPPLASASATRDPLVATTASAIATQGFIGPGTVNSADAYGTSNGSIILDGDGVFVITIPWTISITSDAAAPGIASADLFVTAQDAIGAQYSEIYAGYSTDFGDPDGDYQGAIAWAFGNQGIGFIDFTTDINAYAEMENVPEPSSLVLLLVSGLCGLAWFGRRRLKK